MVAWPEPETNCWDEGDETGGGRKSRNPIPQDAPGRAASWLGGALGHSIIMMVWYLASL